MTTSEQVAILARITTRTEGGIHFTARYSDDDLAALEADGLIVIERPVHPTGIPYSHEFWTIELSSDGLALVEANEEEWPTED